MGQKRLSTQADGGGFSKIQSFYAGRAYRWRFIRMEKARGSARSERRVGAGFSRGDVGDDCAFVTLRKDRLPIRWRSTHCTIRTKSISQHEKFSIPSTIEHPVRTGGHEGKPDEVSCSKLKGYIIGYKYSFVGI
jgi:hypothetical protein